MSYGGFHASVMRWRRHAFRNAKSARVGLTTLLAAITWIAPAQAQTDTTPTPASLVTLVNSGIYAFNGLERQAAAANDAAYTSLLPICTAAPQTGAVSASCTGATAQLFDRLRQLEDTAKELLGGGARQFSLRLSPQDLGFALRWTAPEEYAADGSVVSKFANSQNAVLLNRFAALRFASRAGGLTKLESHASGTDGWMLAYNSDAAVGGAASADSTPLFSRWSAFVNAGYGTGFKDQTTFEDAFSFDGTEVSVGADVRLSDRLVVGLLAGHTERRVDFNSAESIVDGSIRGNGGSGIAYVQFETDAFFVNASLGIQHLSLATRRRITYPSNNPDIPSVSETSLSDTGATSRIATLGAGYTYHYRGLSAEPYLGLNYANTTIAGFTEHGGNGFDFNVAGQSIKSLEGSAGLRFQYALLGPFGVLVPYAYGEVREQFSDKSREIDSTYADGVGPTGYQLPTDSPTKHYYVAGGGGSLVLKHGLQGFIQYVRVLHYENYHDHVVSGGIRWEF